MEFPSSIQINREIPIPYLPSPDFPALPSWKWYRETSREGKLSSPGQMVRTSLPNHVGSVEDQRMSIVAWYSMKDPSNILNTPYATSSNEARNIAFSVKKRIRQPLNEQDTDFVLPTDIYPILLSSKKSISDYLQDIVLFPFHPSANLALAIICTQNREPDMIRQYFQDCGIDWLIDHPIEYYPDYALFFLLTRMASYPFSADQLILIQLRLKGTDSQRKIIDSIFDLPLSQETFSMLSTPPPGAAPGWERFASEYIRFYLPRKVEGSTSWFIQTRFNVGLSSLLNWTDQQILDLAVQNHLEIPTLNEMDSREDWVSEVLNLLRRYCRVQTST